MLTTAQCRAARALLKWNQQDLADRSEVAVSTIKKFETETTAPHNSTLKLLRQTFEAQGIEFIDEGSGGVWLKG
ncbi:MAG: helix-turn-helix domain-containing protein [Sphingomonadales bacterium]|nr:helix-turn-helix domain-containing protein [Sphingomonadales bacterium]